MTLQATYNEEELGWVTDKFQIDGDIILEVELESMGRVAVKKGNAIDSPYPIIFVSPLGYDKHEYIIDGDTEGKYLQIITSEKPIDIQYEYI